MSKIKTNTIENVAGTVSVDVKDLASGNIESGPGWTKFPDGTLIQYGMTPGFTVSGPVQVPLPIAFLSADYRVTVTMETDKQIIADTDNISLSRIRYSTNFTVFNSKIGSDGATRHGHYIAIGRWK